MVSEGIFIPRLKLDNFTYLQQVHSRCRLPMRGQAEETNTLAEQGCFVLDGRWF